MHRLCRSVAMRARAATDPLRDGDSKYAIGAIEEDEFRLDRSRLASGFSGGGNRRIPPLHYRGWVGGAFRAGHPYFVQTSAGPGAASRRTAIVDKLCGFRPWTHFRKVRPEKR